MSRFTTNLKNVLSHSTPLVCMFILGVSLLGAPLLNQQAAAAATTWKTANQCIAESKNSSDDTYATRCMNYQSTEGMVYRAYRVVLGRQPDRAGFNYWVGRANNAVKNGRYPVHVVITGMMRSHEYRSRIMTENTQVFVGETFQRAYHQAGSAKSIAYWTNQINSGKITHAKFLAIFTQRERTKTTWSLEAPCYITHFSSSYCAG